MSRDLIRLYDLIERQFEVVSKSISYIKNTVDSMEELNDETYFLTRDTFELLLLCRAYRDMVEEIL
jgi:hypothetical protein